MILHRSTIPVSIFLATWIALLSCAYADDWIYTTRPGDTLWDISKNYLNNTNDYTKIQSYNDIREPRSIPPGTRLRIPFNWLKKQPIAAQVIHIRQPVEIIPPDGMTSEEVLNKINAKLHNGTEIRTGSQGNLTLRFADGSTMLIQSDTTLVLDAVSAFNKEGMVDTRMRLQKGRIDTKVTPLTHPKSRFEITTPAAVAAVRGTNFRVNADSDHAIMRSEVLGGAVGVSGAGVTQHVRAGFGSIANVGKPPQAPQALLPPPDLSGLTDNINRLPISLSWPDLIGAKTYRFQLAKDESFDHLMLDNQLTQSSINLNSLDDGSYALRIRGIDESKLEGRNTTHAFVVNTQLSAPLLITPIDASALRNTPLVFSWDAQANATAYHFQLSKVSTFSNYLIKRSLSEARLKLTDTLQPGTYFWRVAAENTRSQLGPYSELRSLTIQAPPTPPLVSLDRTHRGEAILRWPAVNEAAHYQLQLSHDETFSKIFVDKTITDTTYIVSPQNKHFFYRVRSVATDDAYGAFSTIQYAQHTPQPSWPILVIYILALLL